MRKPTPVSKPGPGVETWLGQVLRDSGHPPPELPAPSHRNTAPAPRSAPRHPDKNKDPGAEDKFIQISKAYEVRRSQCSALSKL